MGWGSPGGSTGRNLPAVQEAQEVWVRSLGQEDPLEKGMATHSTLVWRIPWTEDPDADSPWGCKELDTTERLGPHAVCDGLVREGCAVKGEDDSQGPSLWLSRLFTV